MLRNVRWTKTKENTDSENARGRFPRESGGNRGCAVYHKGLGWLPSVGYLHMKHPFPDVASGAYLGQWAVPWSGRSSIWIGPRDHFYEYPGVYLDSVNSWLLLSIMSNGGPTCIIAYQLEGWNTTSSFSYMSCDCACDCLFVCEFNIFGFRKYFENPLYCVYAYIYMIFCTHPFLFRVSSFTWIWRRSRLRRWLTIHIWWIFQLDHYVQSGGCGIMTGMLTSMSITGCWHYGWRDLVRD